MPDRRAEQSLVGGPGAALRQAVAIRDLLANPPDDGERGIGPQQAGSSSGISRCERAIASSR
jgi:hypothetical protein